MEFYDYNIEEEIQKAIHGEAYIAALALALTIPDMCCSNNSTRQDYVNWFDLYVNPNHESNQITGKECYALRCAFLHQQDGDIKKQQILQYEHTNITFGIVIPNNKYSMRVQFVLNYEDADISIHNGVASIEAIALIKNILSGYKLFKQLNPYYVEQHNKIYIFK